MMTDVEQIKRFALAGRSTLTLSSARTGVRYTYKIKKIENDADKFFVSLLTGADNENSFSYLGLLDTKKQGLRLTARSCAGDEAGSVRAARFFCRKVLFEGTLPEHLEVRHEGRCGRCNRKLTTPESIDRGIGPECWNHM